MESLAHVQSFVQEHAMTIGVGLLVIIAVAAVAWFLVGRGPAESKELENQARINEASMEGYQGPPNAMAAPPPIPPPASMPEGMAPPQGEEEMEA